MKRLIACFAAAAFALGLFLTVHVRAQQPGRSLVPLTEDNLKNPSPNDWLMYNRTYDAQRFSPLQQINQSNVAQLKVAWSITQGAGSQEGIPLVHDGVMYLQAPGACRYITPSCTSGIPSCVPGPSVIDQASLSWPTLDSLICCSGEKRCAS